MEWDGNGFGIGGLRGNDFMLMVYSSHHNEAPQGGFFYISHCLQWSI